jgi:SAM-dependent methyltransferase
MGKRRVALRAMAISAGHKQPEMGPAARVRRLNWGGDARRDWINLDRTAGPGVDLVADIREGLPIESGTIDYAVGVNTLQDLALPELGPALAELIRVLRPGGMLRLAVPDLDADIRAYAEHDDGHFVVAPFEARSRGGRFIAHTLGWGRSRSLFTFDYIEELLVDAGFVDVTRCRSEESAGRFQAIVELDERGGSRETIFVEATRPPGRHPFLRVLEVAAVEGDRKRLAGFNLDAPQPGGLSHDGSLEIVGWVVGRHSRASEVEVLADGELVGGAPVDLVRPGVGRKFAGAPGSRSAGFRIVLTADGVGISELVVRARLEEGSPTPLGTMRIEASRTAPPHAG